MSIGLAVTRASSLSTSAAGMIPIDHGRVREERSEERLERAISTRLGDLEGGPADRLGAAGIAGQHRDVDRVPRPLGRHRDIVTDVE